MPRTDYDRIGLAYAHRRRADPRIAAAITAALGSASRVVNVGAGTGNYEPPDRLVVAVEPSPVMVAQRRRGAAPVVRAAAEALPFQSSSFDVALCVLTAHHWSDRDAGFAELRRVAAAQVVFFFEPECTDDAWIMQYWPEIRDLPSEIDPPGEAVLRDALDVREVRAVPIPHDCTDGFAGAFWARPEAYLDAETRGGMSSLAQLDAEAVARGSARLRDDLGSGRWDERFGYLRELSERDLGYRIAIAGQVRSIT